MSWRRPQRWPKGKQVIIKVKVVEACSPGRRADGACADRCLWGLIPSFPVGPAVATHTHTSGVLLYQTDNKCLATLMMKTMIWAFNFPPWRRRREPRATEARGKW